MDDREVRELQGEVDLNKWLGAHAAAAARNDRFEDTVVRHVMKYISRETKVLGKKAFREMYGSEPMKLEHLVGLYSFPLYLVARKIPWVHEITVDRLFNRFSSLPIAKSFLEILNTKPDTWAGPVGLAFHWPGVEDDRSIMVLHNMATDVAKLRGRFNFRMDDGDADFVDVSLEPLSGLLTSIYQ